MEPVNMCCNQPFTDTSGELNWVIRMRHFLDGDLEGDDEIVVSVPTVPNGLASFKPEAYMPQIVSIGPYHHRLPELQDMEMYKLSVAKQTQSRFLGIKFKDIVDDFTELGFKIRSHYHRYLNYNAETLAWMVAIDSAFLLEFLKIHGEVKDATPSRGLPMRMSHLMDLGGRKSSHNMIVRDVLMVENQIPLFLLRKFIEAQLQSVQEVNEAFSTILRKFVEKINPFALDFEHYRQIDDNSQHHHHHHLLALLYNVITPEPTEICLELEEQDFSDVESTNDSKCSPVCATEFFLGCAKWILVTVCFKTVTNFPTLLLFKHSFERFFSSTPPDNFGPSSQTMNNPPLPEEITIPSVSELIDAGVKFTPAPKGLSTINFNTNTGEFCLPTVILDVNSEVIIRNLVAYEVSVIDGPWVVTRFTDLMNGIIDTANDVKLLRKAGLVMNHMRSDEEVANMWNGMSKSVKMTRVALLDKVVEDVNKFYKSRWRIKVSKLMRRNGLGSWQCPKLLFGVLVLFLVCLHVFCLFHGCAQ